MKHKLMQAMLEREATRQLSGLVQIDDAYWGGGAAATGADAARVTLPRFDVRHPTQP